MRDEHMYYTKVNERLEKAGEKSEHPDKEKLLDYLFLCFAYELKNDNAEAILLEPVWSNPEKTFSILMHYAGAVSHDYCCSCIDVLGGKWRRECGTTTTAYMNSKIERDEVKNRFIALLDNTQDRLIGLYSKTPQEYFFLKTKPIITEVYSTNSKHIATLQTDIQDSVDMLCAEETMQPWADYERIRDYYEISVDDSGMAEIKLVFYRIRTQKKFLKYMDNLGIKEATV